MSLDRFSAQAAQYARYRIDYPPELYAWLLPQVTSRIRAWDCAFQPMVDVIEREAQVRNV